MTWSYDSVELSTSLAQVRLLIGDTDEATAQLSDEEIQKILGHVRGFCPDGRWPRGELNLPRPLVTEKAFPEDEAVLTTIVAAEGPGAVTNKLVYERRFGPTSQIEVMLPFAAKRTGTNGWAGGVGDIALGMKQVLFHSMRSGSILSLSGEAVLPSGDDKRGRGKGYTVFELIHRLPGDGWEGRSEWI